MKKQTLKIKLYWMTPDFVRHYDLDVMLDGTSYDVAVERWKQHSSDMHQRINSGEIIDYQVELAETLD